MGFLKENIVILIFASVAMAVSASKGFSVGTALTYHLSSTLLFREANIIQHSTGNVGFQTTGQLEVAPLWKDPRDPDILLLSLKFYSPELLIKSRKAPKFDGFVTHSSNFQKIPEDPILILWRNGDVFKLFASPFESISSLNYKRGLASLFQYKIFDGTIQEIDASGFCNVTYTSMGPQTFEKVKRDCVTHNFPEVIQHPNPLLRVNISNKRVSVYELTESMLPSEVIEDEHHVLTLALKNNAGTIVYSHRIARLLPEEKSVVSIPGASYKDVVKTLNPSYKEVSIHLQYEPLKCTELNCPTLEKLLQSSQSSLETQYMGSAKSSSAFLKLIPYVQEASMEELTKILKSPKYHDIKYQLYDLYGSASTLTAHKAAMKLLRQDEKGEYTERYLWALSMSSHPNKQVIFDVLEKSEETMENDKLSETYALTAAAMAKKFGDSDVIKRVHKSLERGLQTCTGEDCQLKFLRALRNLGSEASIPTFLSYASIGVTKSLNIAAWKGINSLRPEHITKKIKVAAANTFYQIGGPRRDSTVRTLALNVILESNPSENDLRRLLLYLTTQDSAYEVKKYLSQRLQQIAESNLEFERKLKAIEKREWQKLNNYNVQATRGLSTAFTRSFLKSPSSNGSLLTIQEISNGLLKRGIVDVVLETEQHKTTFFSLGLFASGLSTFVSSSDQEESNAIETEMSTAGMELSLLDVNIRPFVFFTGQAELMSHVWSGTASERTPAFQIISNLHRHREIIPLASGFIAEIEVDGAVSFDLAGQLQLSLWSRNAQSNVEMGAGLSVQGSTKVSTDFVKSAAEFRLTLEPKLDLSSDLDFSGPVSLCMKLTQPETVIKYHVYKVERIPGSRHRLRKTRRSKLLVPGKCYLLNRKNNEMCSNIFS